MSGAWPTASPRHPHYTLSNDWEFADERLALLGAAYDPANIALAPGGVLLLEEGDEFGVLDEMSGAFGDVWRTFARSTEIAGTDQACVREML